MGYPINLIKHEGIRYLHRVDVKTQDCHDGMSGVLGTKMKVPSPEMQTNPELI
jgi:hypothetical protein